MLGSTPDSQHPLLLEPSQSPCELHFYRRGSRGPERFSDLSRELSQKQAAALGLDTEPQPRPLRALLLGVRRKHSDR